MEVQHQYFCYFCALLLGFEDLGEGKRLQPATTALVVMAKGITERWKQHLVYYLVNNSCRVKDLKKIIFNTIKKLSEAGFDVKAVISDMGSNFLQLSTELGITADQTWFQVKFYYYSCQLSLITTF